MRDWDYLVMPVSTDPASVACVMMISSLSVFSNTGATDKDGSLGGSGPHGKL